MSACCDSLGNVTGSCGQPSSSGGGGNEEEEEEEEVGGRERRREGHPGGAELEQNFYFLKLNWFHFCFISIFLLCVYVCFIKCSCAFTRTIQNSGRNNHTMDRKCLIFVLFSHIENKLRCVVIMQDANTGADRCDMMHLNQSCGCGAECRCSTTRER